MHKRSHLPVSLLILLASLGGTCTFAAEESGVTTRQVDLLGEPRPGSTKVGKLAADTQVQIRKRQGGWYLINADKALQGWLRMFNLRFAASTRDSGGFRSMLETVSSNTGGSGTATGVRGLDPAMLQASKSSPAELRRFLQMHYSMDDAGHFAKVNGIARREVPYDR